jgi:FHS family L-fucose permease-like MFS transporter
MAEIAVAQKNNQIQNQMAAITTNTSSANPGNTTGANYRGSFAIMTSLFFMWGFITSINDILVPRFKDAFALDNFQASLVQSAFFGAYFIGSLAYFCVSATKGDPIARIGYKNGVVIGLVLAAIGTSLVWLGATVHVYALILGALFIIGLGLAMLQIAANPYVTILGPEQTASSRLNLAQAFNSVGTTVGPLVGGYLIFQYFARPGENEADSVRIPYLAISAAFLLLAVIYFFTHLPHVGEGKIERGMGALKYPQVLLGVLAIFMYVGGEVAIGSNLIKFLGQKSVAGLSDFEASKYVSLFWGGMLIGRFMGAVELSEMKKRSKQLFLAAIPLAGFLILWATRGWDVVQCYLPFLVLCWALFQCGQALAGRTLMIFGLTVVTLLLVAILVGGKTAMWCVIGVGLFTSIGWPNIFSLALEGTGVLKSQVSSLLVMAILGGAILPPVQGYIADATKNLQISFIVPLIAYAYIAFYGAKGHAIGRNKILAANNETA